MIVEAKIKPKSSDEIAVTALFSRKLTLYLNTQNFSKSMFSASNLAEKRVLLSWEINARAKTFAYTKYQNFLKLPNLKVPLSEYF